MPRRPFLTSLARAALVASAIPPAVIVSADQVSGTSPGHPQITLDDPDGALGRTRAPVFLSISLVGLLRQAAVEGRLILREQTPNSDRRAELPVQCLSAPNGDEMKLCFLLPPGRSGQRVFVLETTARLPISMEAVAANGQYEITERGKTVLRYNYSTVAPGDVLKSVSEDNRKYAVARSDYIHPLFGPHGEVLSKDWSVDHPHHRGIYWAWPEVDWRGERADLHALQNVFARPTGKCETRSGPVFAELRAENVWKWKDREPVVRELAAIRTYPSSPAGRLVDLEFRFEALGEPVLLARRGTDHYGGLNLRFNAIEGQKMTKQFSAPISGPSVAWADISGTFMGASAPSGLTIVQLRSNPCYPGDWVDYPELNWLQPTFPAKGTRYELKKGQGLTLRFRLWIHPGLLSSNDQGDNSWRAANRFDWGA